MTRRLLVAAVAVLAGAAPVPTVLRPEKPSHERGFRSTDATAIAPRPFGEFLRWQRRRWSLEIQPPRRPLSNVPDLRLHPEEP